MGKPGGSTPGSWGGAGAPGAPGNGPTIRTRGELRAAGYRPRTVKEEMRENVLRRITSGESLFPGVIGYEETVTPQVAAAVLSRHDLLLLGLRGQAKTRMLRSMVELLDEWMPIISPEAGDGVELRDDPLHPLTRSGREAVARLGDQTPVAWVHRSERYMEKLATPDVTIADLIGEIDLVKYAAGRELADERTMHYGLIPRANRGIFVINELPDLAPRIQVGLFNVLEERDVQIRGYPVRLELDVCIMFSANPEDYTNRGRIVTPLKDRIGSVVRTHYPTDNEEAMRITRENAFLRRGAGAQRDRGSESTTGSGGAGEPEDWSTAGAAPTWHEVTPPEVVLPEVMHEIVEEMIRQARRSPHINQASGVSVRASMAAVENVVSAAELRGLKTGAERVVVRVCDLPGVLAACRGKIELMLGDDGGDGRSTEDRLLEALLGEAVKTVAGRRLSVGKLEEIAEAFSGGVRLELGDDVPAGEAVASMGHIPGLIDAARALARSLSMDPQDVESVASCGELVLEFLYVNNRISKVKGGYTR